MPELNRLSLTEDDSTVVLTDATQSASDPEHGMLVFFFSRSYLMEIVISLQMKCKKNHDWVEPFI